MNKHNITLIVLLAGTCFGFSQGFVNLDFEAANLKGYSSGSEVPAANAFPGWTVNALIIYDNLSLSGESASICDTNNPTLIPAIQGRYFAILTSGNYPGTGVPISMGQTGQIPLWAQTISFWGDIGGLQITFGGQPLSFNATGGTPNYAVYQADISAFAGQTGQLLFTLPPYVSDARLDNIQFSSSPVPEPGAFGLFVLGGVLLAWRRLRK
jgi:hypothetical protein